MVAGSVQRARARARVHAGAAHLSSTSLKTSAKRLRSDGGSSADASCRVSTAACFSDLTPGLIVAPDILAARERASGGADGRARAQWTALQRV